MRVVLDELWIEFALDATQQRPTGAVEGEIVELDFGKFGAKGMFEGGEKGEGGEGVSGEKMAVEGFLLLGPALGGFRK